MGEGWGGGKPGERAKKALEKPSFAEAVVSGGAVFGGEAEDDVVEEMDLHGGGGFADAAGHGEVGGAGARVAGGVVVDEDEAVGGVHDGGAEDFAGVGDGFGEAAAGDFLHGDEGAAGGEEDDFEDLEGFGAHFGAEQVGDGLGGIEALVGGGGAGEAFAEFESGEEVEGFGGAEAFLFLDFAGGDAAEGGEATVFFEEDAADIDGAEAGNSGAAIVPLRSSPGVVYPFPLLTCSIQS